MEYLPEPFTDLVALGTQVMVGGWLSTTVTKKVVAVVPQELVAITDTGVVPLKKV
jgi:hypothetical protein